MIDQSLVEDLGEELYAAWKKCVMVDPLTERYPNLQMEDAYRIQQRIIAHRVEAGEGVIGKKIGVTSKPVMQMLGVSQPDFGQLLNGMVYGQGNVIPRDSLIQPKAEGEIAFVMKKDLQGPGISAADVLAATEGVMVCFEIVDSRVRDWRIKIQDTIADNASCGVFVLGDRLIRPRSLNLSLCGMVLEKNGEVVSTGAGAAAMGSPVNSLVWLANTLGRLGVGIKAGEVVLTGALSAMVPLEKGDNLRVSIDGIGSCSVRFD